MINLTIRLTKLALPLALATLLSGCVIVLSSPFGAFGGKSGLNEILLEGSGDNKVLVLNISGFISDQPSQQAFGLVQQQSTLARVKAELEKAEKDDDIKALVLRINSPGGGVTASDEIYHLLKTYRKQAEVPVIASLGSLATSGGYYVACSADEILAHPTTVTGSVGVLIAGVNVSGLMDKFGVENQTYTSGPHKDILSPFRQSTEGEKEIVDSVVNSLYQRFISVVDENRPTLDRGRMNEITDGRIFAATQALEAGLIDNIGRIDDAIAAAKSRAGISEAQVITYHRGEGSAENIYSQLAGIPPAASLLPLAANLQSATTPQMLYLWRPGLQ